MLATLSVADGEDGALQSIMPCNNCWSRADPPSPVDGDAPLPTESGGCVTDGNVQKIPRTIPVVAQSSQKTRLVCSDFVPATHTNPISFKLNFSIECYCTVVWNLVLKYCIVGPL